MKSRQLGQFGVDANTQGIGIAQSRSPATRLPMQYLVVHGGGLIDHNVQLDAAHGLLGQLVEGIGF